MFVRVPLPMGNVSTCQPLTPMKQVDSLAKTSPHHAGDLLGRYLAAECNQARVPRRLVLRTLQMSLREAELMPSHAQTALTTSVVPS